MNLAAGAAGALTTNALHELTRRVVRDAPRIDLLGMQAMARMYRGVGSPAPTGDTLYVRTLIGDLAANAAYFSLVSLGGDRAPLFGGALGIAAGIGALVITPRAGLADVTVARTPLTRILTVALYAAGGLVAGAVHAASRRSP